jgi:hypothetical protein
MSENVSALTWGMFSPMMFNTSSVIEKHRGAGLNQAPGPGRPCPRTARVGSGPGRKSWHFLASRRTPANTQGLVSAGPAIVSEGLQVGVPIAPRIAASSAALSCSLSPPRRCTPGSFRPVTPGPWPPARGPTPYPRVLPRSYPLRYSRRALYRTPILSPAATPRRSGSRGNR